MTTTLPSVPFWSYDADDEDFTIHGLLRFEENVLHVEYQIKDSEDRLLKDIHTLTIRLTDLDAVRFSRNIFWATLTLRVRSLSLLKEVPGTRRGELKLRFSRKYRSEAHALATQLQLRMSERKLKRIDEEMRKLDDS